ncbi:MAG: tRNA (adenosine(37)-N6)-threonylcarbamoyltransferase complex transferase subunit TsaD, partial [Clostridia bacterium]|nr:tRNA (adenosine(37)-N6)-threonylcarbamoyltransferase complex transferase subunit TsaD [Clostridia bacterium]
AAEKTGYKTLALSGGVSANSELRRRMQEECEKRGIKLYYPPLKYCGDNAAVVGVQGYYEYLSGNTADVSLNATATLPIDYRE